MTEENSRELYAAFKSKDSRFDGRFFVGVSSTGIYCRPVCRAKMPKAENCTYYKTAAEAEYAGFRPCLSCRPELAPGTMITPTDATADLAHRAARLLERECGSGQKVEELAARLGCTGRHLRRAFTAEYNVPPVQYLQTCRLLLSKNLLMQTDLPVHKIAKASGFRDLRHFNVLFKKQYHLTPTMIRRQKSEKEKQSETVTLALGYRPPYQWQQILDFLEARAISGVEIVRNDEYLRTVHITAEEQHLYGWVRVGNRPDKNVLTVTISETLLPALPDILFRIRHLFDLYCDPDAVYETLSEMNDIKSDLCVLGTRLPGCFDPYETAVRAVLGQQITVKAARTLAGRLAETYGTPIQTGIEGLTHTFPQPENILDLSDSITENLGLLGIISARSKTILMLSQAFVNGSIDFEFCIQPEIEMKKLLKITGIGPWTAKYIAMRTMGWPDVFLETDAGIKKALAPRTEKEMAEMALAWKPWRSYATINLWNSLE
ncbi:putative bifunctional transcriptional activator/DNA repair enzyme AlkA [Methanimicrococcus sp. At1]|uniref:Bifunctional transcriptional activator/DNA repair enzyme AlkA n=1 Tax=Methanimicrococcus hacksteinii TaxID=3028293 RepID=A0ABU3VRQ1_9EURY|nr:AlkA N-terminal domain-containing protein [Methanimicrococcus sp. At1]MDV0446000.1 putative bifunctional transcriptional activator/DNA repair enzyme AlkA [Methanimicrococcus sp. At1]